MQMIEGCPKFEFDCQNNPTNVKLLLDIAGVLPGKVTAGDTCAQSTWPIAAIIAVAFIAAIAVGEGALLWWCSRRSRSGGRWNQLEGPDDVPAPT